MTTQNAPEPSARSLAKAGDVLKLCETPPDPNAFSDLLLAVARALDAERRKALEEAAAMLEKDRMIASAAQIRALADAPPAPEPEACPTCGKYGESYCKASGLHDALRNDPPEPPASAEPDAELIEQIAKEEHDGTNDGVRDLARRVIALVRDDDVVSEHAQQSARYWREAAQRENARYRAAEASSQLLREALAEARAEAAPPPAPDMWRVEINNYEWARIVDSKGQRLGSVSMGNLLATAIVAAHNASQGVKA